jgi:hypothetical protein
MHSSQCPTQLFVHTRTWSCARHNQVGLEGADALGTTAGHRVGAAGQWTKLRVAAAAGPSFCRVLAVADSCGDGCCQVRITQGLMACDQCGAALQPCSTPHTSTAHQLATLDSAKLPPDAVSSAALLLPPKDTSTSYVWPGHSEVTGCPPRLTSKAMDESGCGVRWPAILPVGACVQLLAYLRLWKYIGYPWDPRTAPVSSKASSSSTPLEAMPSCHSNSTSATGQCDD